MSRIISDLIRSKVAADAIDEMAAANLVALIHDALPADAGLDAVDEAISRAREGFSPLFRKPAPDNAASNAGVTRSDTKPAGTRPRVLATVAGAYPMRRVSK